MKNFCFQNNFKLILIFAILLFIFIPAGCGAAKTLADNFGSNRLNVANTASKAEPAATPNTRQTAQCQNLLGGNRRNRLNDMGELPADMPLPRGTFLCGYVDGQRSTYFINSALSGEAVAQFYRDTLPAQDFVLQMDNAQNGGRFMNFGRGTSETIQIESRLSTGAEFRDVFSVAYMPPRDERGEELTGTMIMRHGNSSRNANASNRNSQSANDCGDHTVGSIDCAATKNPTNRQFSMEIIKPDGSRRTYTGERIQRGHNAIILHVTITGASAQSDGEWWDKLSGDGQTTDAQNTFRKINGVWTRQTRKPTEQEYQNLILATNVIQFADVAAARPVLIGTETVNGEICNHFQLKYDSSGANVTDYWISQRTGYAIRRQTKMNNQTTIVNESRQGENLQIETPAGAE